MKLCFLIKYPPIQGGVSAQGYWAARAIAERGHDVHVVTNAEEVEPSYRLMLDDGDRELLAPRFERGRIWLHGTEPMSRKLAHIPQANPFVSKLAGRAVEVVRRFGCELVFSYYFEPYGVAGHLVSSWTGLPHVMRHAGSDLGRLMLNPDLAPTYAEIVRRADGIVSGNRHPFVAQGLAADAVYRVAPYYLPVDFFHPEAPALDVDATVATLRRLADGGAGPDVVAPGSFDAGAPTIGIYGKLGEQKGSFDLVRALGILKRKGLSFQLVAISQGATLDAFHRAVEGAGIAASTWVLPFVAHWKVAQFIRACTAVCFLERDFQISFHAPSVPREVLACGTCLVLSGEILEKQTWKDQMIDGENFVSIPDPKDVEQLASALERVVRDPAAARRIGAKGAAVTYRRASADELARAYEDVFADVIERRRGRPAPAAHSRDSRESRDSRVADLRALLPQLAGVLGDARFAERAEAHVASAAATGDANADARAFLDAIDGAGLDAVTRDAIAFSRHLLWMGHDVDGESVARPFGEAIDAAARKPGPAHLPEQAPLASANARVVRFEHLSERAAMRSRGGAEKPGCTVLFNKQANFLGHYFVVSDWEARLLASCDGTTPVREIVRRLAAADAKRRTVDEVRAIVLAALRAFYRNHVLVFVEPRRAAT